MRLLGITPKMVQYGHTIVQFNLPNQDQGVEFAQNHTCQPAAIFCPIYKARSNGY